MLGLVLFLFSLKSAQSVLQSKNPNDFDFIDRLCFLFILSSPRIRRGKIFIEELKN